MINQYRVSITSKNLYREVSIPFDAMSYSIGTTVDCNFRLRRELFFEDVRICFLNTNNVWTVTCSDNLYISKGDTVKLFTRQVTHGESFEVKYQGSNNVVFTVEFNVDFDSENKKYERKIDIGSQNTISIGSGNGNNIILKSQYIYNDQVELIKQAGGLRLSIRNTTYGVCRNGNKAANNEIIKEGDFFSISDFYFYYKSGALWTEIRNDLSVSGLRVSDYPNQNNYPKFHRNTRVKLSLDEKEIEILDPPAKQEKPESHLFMNLLPAFGMLLTSGLMAFMGGSMIIFSIISGVMAIITTIAGVIQSKKDFKKKSAERVEKYNAYVARKDQEIGLARNKEREVLNQIYIPKSKEMERLDCFSPDLFDRRPEDEDFLSVKLGTGSVKAVKKINYKKQEKLEIDDDLQEKPKNLYDKYKFVNDVPVVVSLKELNAVGVVGTLEARHELLKIMVSDIVARHFYTDVNMFLIVDEKNAGIVNKFRFLPYIQNEDINSRNIVCDDDSKKIIFEYLYNEFSKREEKQEKNRNDKHLVLFFYDQCGLMQHPISRYIDKAKSINVTFVFFGNHRNDIPMGCGKLINIFDSSSAQLVDVNESKKSVNFSFEKVTDYEIECISNKLASVETDEVSLEGSLTKNINLFKLLNIFGAEDLNLEERWNSTQVYKSMSVPLGVSKTGVVYLDLHDKAHGPHGLVAGTTGSGKSEILQTYILSIATYFHPYEVAFVIIDFKGGGMVNQFRELPHLLGAITNIDGKEIDRSLKSIKAELQKRQRYFAEADVNHIDKYIQKYKAGEVKEPLPHLVIIVDEFAELKAEQPDFMKELISAARIGRSLGVHLILATQKPAGQVDEQIWSNSRFKLCLKVQGPEDSNEVLKSPLAAEIKEPGRAYLQVGNNEIFELFQSAYSGASEKAMDNLVKPFKVSEVSSSGRRNLIFEQKKAQGGETGRSQLDAIVEYVHDFCDSRSIKRLPNICLPSLEKTISFDPNKYDIRNPLMDIGIYDDPDNQYQGPAYIDIDTKNTLIIGSSQYGKTNMLQLLIREIATKYSPNEAEMYILDFGSMVLKTFEKLSHVGGVVCASDDEKLKNLFKLLSEEVFTRKEKIVSVGVSSFSAYCEAGYRDIPRIYVFIDNLTALMELYLEDDDSLLVFLREGISVGITFVIANNASSGISYKYISNFANMIALYNNDIGEYSNIFDRPQIQPECTPGRMILSIDKTIYEAQSYLAFQGVKEIDRAKDINAFIDDINARNEGKKAKVIPFIPKLLTKEELKENYLAEYQDYMLPLGLNYEDVLPEVLDISRLGVIGISGKQGTGHKNLIAYMLSTMDENKDTCPVSVTIIDDVNRRFEEFKDYSIVSKYTLDYKQVGSVIESYYNTLEKRYDEMYETDSSNKKKTLLMLIINNNDAAKQIADDYEIMDKYREIVSAYKDMGVCIIFSNYPNQEISYSAPEPLQKIKSDRHLIYMGSLNELKIIDVSYDEARKYKKKSTIGDAFYINDSEMHKIKVVKHI